MNRERSLNALLLKLTRENPAFTQLQSKLTRTLGTSFRLTVIATLDRAFFISSLVGISSDSVTTGGF
jgi:hypothetical protein